MISELDILLHYCRIIALPSITSFPSVVLHIVFSSYLLLPKSFTTSTSPINESPWEMSIRYFIYWLR